MANTYEFIIVGGGISGLVAGYELKKKGHSFIIIEPSDIGGCIQTRFIDNFKCELGANTFVLTKQMSQLLTELKLDSYISFPSIKKYKQYVWSTELNKICALPRGPLKLLTTRFFTFKEKLQIIKGIFTTNQKLEYNETILESFSKLIGESVVNKALNPALRGIFGGAVDKLLTRKTFPGIFEFINKKVSLFGYIRSKKKRKIFQLRGGNQILVEKLKKELSENILKDEVISLNYQNNNIKIIATKLECSSSNIIFTTTGIKTAVIINNCLVPETVKLKETLLKVRYAKIGSIHFVTKEPLPKQGFGVLFPFSANSKIIGVLFNELLFPENSTEEKVITVCVGGVESNIIETETDENLINIAKEEISKYLNITDAKFLQIKRWPFAIPQYEIDTSELDELFINAENKVKGLYFLGADRGFIGVPDRIDYIQKRIAELLLHI